MKLIPMLAAQLFSLDFENRAINSTFLEDAHLLLNRLIRPLLDNGFA